MRMKKHILSRCMAACLSVVMAMGMCVTANAEEISRSGWGATFTGSALETNFRPSDMYGVMCELLPGDSAEMRVDLKNDSQEYTQWYISNGTLQTLEDTRAAARDGGYSYRLSYTSNGTGQNNSDNIDTSARTVVLFESDTIGGEGSGSKGLYEATENLDEFFQLCNMAPGGSGYVTLYVKLDGETQGNGYQDTLAKLRMIFAVATVPTKYVEVPGESKTEYIQDPDQRVEIPGDPVYVIREEDPPLSDIPKYTNVPQTGDNIRLVLWSTAAMLSGLGCFVLVMARRKKDADSGKGGKA